MVSRQEIREIARNLLMLLDREGIDSNAALERRLDEKIELGEDSQDSVSISVRPSNLGTSALTTSYIRPGFGILLEFKINRELRYSKVILKCQKTMAGYEVFAIDPYNNQVQNKVISASDFESVRGELEALR